MVFSGTRPSLTACLLSTHSFSTQYICISDVKTMRVCLYFMGIHLSQNWHLHNFSRCVRSGVLVMGVQRGLAKHVKALSLFHYFCDWFQSQNMYKTFYLWCMSCEFSLYAESFVGFHSRKAYLSLDSLYVYAM